MLHYFRKDWIKIQGVLTQCFSWIDQIWLHPSRLTIFLLKNAPGNFPQKVHVTPILSENSTFHLLPHQKKGGERVSDFPGPQKWPLVCLTPSELWQRVKDWKQHIWNWAINEMKETEVKMSSICLLSRPLPRTWVIISSAVWVFQDSLLQSNLITTITGTQLLGPTGAKHRPEVRAREW